MLQNEKEQNAAGDGVWKLKKKIRHIKIHCVREDESSVSLPEIRGATETVTWAGPTLAAFCLSCSVAKLCQPYPFCPSYQSEVSRGSWAFVPSSSHTVPRHPTQCDDSLVRQLTCETDG